MNRCINCAHWQRSGDPIIGTCGMPEFEPEVLRFQYEGCGNFTEGEKRMPYNEKGWARRAYEPVSIAVTPEKEAEIVRMLERGLNQAEIRREARIGSVKLSAVTKKHHDALATGAQARKSRKPNPIEEHADEIKRMLDRGASFFRVGKQFGINRQSLSRYAKQAGWRNE